MPMTNAERHRKWYYAHRAERLEQLARKRTLANLQSFANVAQMLGMEVTPMYETNTKPARMERGTNEPFHRLQQRDRKSTLIYFLMPTNDRGADLAGCRWTITTQDTTGTIAEHEPMQTVERNGVACIHWIIPDNLTECVGRVSVQLVAHKTIDGKEGLYHSAIRFFEVLPSMEGCC